MQAFDIENLVLDAAPLLSTASSSSLRGLARNFVTTPDVIAEIRDKTSRELFKNTLQVLNLAHGSGEEGNSDELGGLKVRDPSADAVLRVTNFAKLTGDIAVLSEADVRVLALSYTIEVERNGTRRLRPAPGHPSQEEREREQKKKARLNKEAELAMEKLQKVSLEEKSTREKAGSSDTETEDGTSGRLKTASRAPSIITQVTAGPSALSTSSSLGAASTKDTASSVDSGSEAWCEDEEYSEAASVVSGMHTESSEDGYTNVAPSSSKSRSNEEQAEGSDDDDGGDWITPTNVALHKSRDLGLFPSLPASTSDNPFGPRSNGKAAKSKTLLKVACLTGDYAMQNVALQMGLNVFGVNGKKIREVKTWVLRCHGCFKLCKDPVKKFCPSCGGPSLIRTSITYVTPTPENPKGYVLHLKANFQYRLRGTQFSIPPPKPGSSNAMKNTNSSDLILREDQKEYQRGVKSYEISKMKQEKAAAKAMREGKGSSAAFGGGFGAQSFDDPDWLPGMVTKQGGNNTGVRVGKDGLPIIGYGKRNPNASRGRKR